MIKQILILAILLTGAILFINRNDEKVTVVEENPNEKIFAAFEDFKKFANKKPTVAAETLCQGGFINTTRTELKKVASDIISTRTDVKNQDEAGITCLSDAHHWVLFTALDNSDYYCMDSTGVSGKYGMNRKTMQCENSI
ncbi:MAG: hypothetical protein V4686_02885 [Patescibacteria group bacterium]